MSPLEYALALGALVFLVGVIVYIIRRRSKEKFNLHGGLAQNKEALVACLSNCENGDSRSHLSVGDSVDCAYSCYRKYDAIARGDTSQPLDVSIDRLCQIECNDKTLNNADHSRPEEVEIYRRKCNVECHRRRECDRQCSIECQYSDVKDCQKLCLRGCNGKAYLD